MSIKARKKPMEVEAFRWENNEPFLREFINDDSLIHFAGNALEIWNSDIKDWVTVPMFYFIIKGIKGEFYPVSAEIFQRTFEIVED